MKAKEIASRIIESGIGDIDDVVNDIMAGMIVETGELAKLRNVKTLGGFAAVVKQQHDKWTAVCNHVDRHYGQDGLLLRDGYLMLLREILPEAYMFALRGGLTAVIPATAGKDD